jgi:diaminohydroxyphosphoribosylaminopyrimidine deaminase / 5-amino-6-(5-phosphoribosylamino)uracil reductase
MMTRGICFSLESGGRVVSFALLTSELRRDEGMELTKERASLESAASILPAMKLALMEAQKFEGATAPNPPVGCVLLDRDGNTLAAAAHQKAGTLHAEALAIKLCRDVGLADKIHTVVVTLEPCNHTGRTGPCTEAILSTSAKNVWIGVADPNPHVAGGGADRLRKTGLHVQFLNQVDAPKLKSDLQRLIAPFKKRALHGLPWVTIKQAVNTQGSMIPPAGQKTFTSQSSLILAHQLRRRADAIITGSGTVLADDPHFTVRLVEDFAYKQRHLVLFDRRRRIPQLYLDAAITRGFKISFADNFLQVLKHLAEQVALEVLVEAGPSLTQSFLNSNLCDEHVLITKGDPDHIQIIQNKERHVFRNH